MTETRSGVKWRRLTAALATLTMATLGLVANPAAALEEEATAGNRTISGTVVFDERTTPAQLAEMQDQLHLGFWLLDANNEPLSMDHLPPADVQFDASTGAFEMRNLPDARVQVFASFQSPINDWLWGVFYANAIVEDGWNYGYLSQPKLDEMIFDLTDGDVFGAVVDFSQARGMLGLRLDGGGKAGYDNVTVIRVSDGSESGPIHGPGGARHEFASTRVIVKVVVDGTAIYYDGTYNGTTDQAKALELEIPVWDVLLLDNWHPTPASIDPDDEVTKPEPEDEVTPEPGDEVSPPEPSDEATDDESGDDATDDESDTNAPGTGPNDNSSEITDGGNTVPTAPTAASLTADNAGDVVLTNLAGAVATLSVGTEHAGKTVFGTVFSTPIALGSAVVTESGHATFTLPEGLNPGAHRISVQQADGALIGWAHVMLEAEKKNELANTGSTGTIAASGVAAMLLLAGAALLIARRQKASAL